MLKILAACCVLAVTTVGCSSSSSEPSASPSQATGASAPQSASAWPAENASASSSPQPSGSESPSGGQASVKRLGVGDAETVEGGELTGSYDKKVVKLKPCPLGPCATQYGPSVWLVTGRAAGTTTVSFKTRSGTVSYQFIVTDK